MDRRAQASLAYTVATDVLAFTLVIAAYAVATLPDLTSSLFFKTLVVFTVVFAYLASVWWRLGSMSANGIFWAKGGFAFSALLALNFVLLPAFLRVALAGTAAQTAAANALAISLAFIEILLAIMIRQGHAYQTKSKWRLIHHSLLAGGVLFLLSLLIPFDKTLAPFLPFLPLRVLAWGVIIVVPRLVQRFAVNLVATPAQPPAARAANRPPQENSARPEPENQGPTPQQNGRPDSRRRRRGHQRRYGGPRRRM